jgi:hypothetical protein
MLYWDFVWNEYKDEVVKLSNEQRFYFALACVENSFKEFLSYSSISQYTEEKSLIMTALDLLWNKKFDKFKTVYKLFEEKIDPNIDVVLLYTFTALSILLKYSGSTFSIVETRNVLSYSYQTVLHKEILSVLESDTSEEEVAEMEKLNKKCLLKIEFQRKLLKDLVDGQVHLESKLLDIKT